jgi:SAM-dependent methyltransferase
MLGFLKEPSLVGLKSGTREYFDAQRQVILRRPLLKRCYDDWYARLLADADSVPGPGALAELGSGGSYLKQLRPEIITSDVSPGIADQVIDGRELPFGDGAVRALFLTHVMHHIPDVSAFFREAQRVLVPGGVISMIEVAHTPFARFFFRNFHHEPYQDEVREWAFTQADSMMDSNQALSWMIFVRDRAVFERQFPTLQIEALELLPWFTYMSSGGVNARYLIPRFMNGVMIGLEWALTPLAGMLSLHWHIRVRKKV